MVEPLTVWKVELTGGNVHEDVEGTLRLGEGALEFEDALAGALVELPYAAITRVKRLRASPVLLVEWEHRAQVLSTAYYLTKPPPLLPGGPGPTETVTSTRVFRPTKRGQRRRNTYYLTSVGTETKPVLIAWVTAVQDRVQAARGA